MAATNTGSKTVLERLLRYSTEIAVVVIVTWIGFRILGAEAQGRVMADHERRAYEIVRAIHFAEHDAVEGGAPRFQFLSELVEKAASDSPLRRLVKVSGVPAQGVEVYRVRGYLVALFLNDPVRNDGRAWSASEVEASEPGAAAYGAFAWPESYQESTQWSFFIDHRGTIFGTWNHKAKFDGFRPPFPPAINPAKDYREADSQSSDSEWFPFDEALGEITTPAARELKGAKK